jgi:hypothetical protein
LLSDDTYLINPTFRDSLCNFPIRPISNGNGNNDSTNSNNGALTSVSLNELQSGSVHQLLVKKIPSSWLKSTNGGKGTDNFSCPNVDTSHEYIQYKGKDVVELIRVGGFNSSNFSDSKFGHDQLVR